MDRTFVRVDWVNAVIAVSRTLSAAILFVMAAGLLSGKAWGRHWGPGLVAVGILLGLANMVVEPFGRQ
jgi:hypothetical protein